MRRSVVVAFLFASACTTQIEGRFIRTNPAPRPMPARAALSVQLYTSGHPEVAYTEIGVIEERLVMGAPDDLLLALLMRMREDAAHRGCDAVVVGGDAEQPVTSAGRAEEHGFWGTCIVYDEPLSARR